MSRNLFKGTDTDQPGLAVVLILTALLFLSFQDALVKSSNAASSLWQFQFLRASFNLTIIVGALAITRRMQLLRATRPLAVLARTLALMLTMIFFFSGSPFLTLSEMGAGLYTYPIFMTILSAVFLGERIGPWRIAAIVAAAAGAVLIVRPFGDGLRIWQVLPILAGLAYAVNATILRRYCRQESPVTMAAWSACGFLAASVTGALVVASLPLAPQTRAVWPFLLDAWPVLSLAIVGVAALAALCNVTGNILIVKAYQSAELSWLAPVDYAYLIFATFWGLVLFDDLPGPWTVAGMALIALAGIITALRQRDSGAATSSPSP